jgi:hypothetical protein
MACMRNVYVGMPRSGSLSNVVSRLWTVGGGLPLQRFEVFFHLRLTCFLNKFTNAWFVHIPDSSIIWPKKPHFEVLRFTCTFDIPLVQWLIPRLFYSLDLCYLAVDTAAWNPQHSREPVSTRCNANSWVSVQNPPVPARSATVCWECESESKAGKERRKLPVSATRPPQRTAEVTEQQRHCYSDVMWVMQSRCCGRYACCFSKFIVSLTWRTGKIIIQNHIVYMCSWRNCLIFFSTKTINPL